MSIPAPANDIAAGAAEGGAAEARDPYWSAAADFTPARLEKALRPRVCTDQAHDWGHVERVFRMGTRLFAGLKLEAARMAAARGGVPPGPGAVLPWHGYPEPDPEWGEAALRVALLCHDIGPKVGGLPNAIVAPGQLWQVLEESGLRLCSAATAEALDAINAHSWRRNVAARTLAEAVVQDADRLDAIGAVGLARCLAYNGQMGRPVHAPQEDGTPSPLSSLGHVGEKLLNIKARLNLPESREIAEGRHKALLDFRARYIAEWEGLA